MAHTSIRDIELYCVWANIVTSVTASRDSLAQFDVAFTAWYTHHSNNYAPSEKAYIHHGIKHIQATMLYIYDTFGIPYGRLSTQASEHAGKVVTIMIFSKSNMHADMFKQIMHDMCIRIKHFSDTLPTSTSAASLRCGACMELGHIRSNKACSKYEQTLAARAAAQK